MEEAKKFGPYKYEVQPDGMVAITRYTGGEAACVIPSEIDGQKVTALKRFAFLCVKGLASVMIPASVTEMEESAFLGCDDLMQIDVSPDNPCFASRDGVLMNKEQTRIVWVPRQFCGKYVIPEGVTAIEGGAFADCEELTSVTFPESLTEIGNSAFSGCAALKSVTLPKGVTNTGNAAFAACTNLTTVILPEGLTHIGHRAFMSCTSLTNVILPQTVTEIGENAFDACMSLTTMTLPEGVTKIGAKAFEDCRSLTSVNIPESVTEMGYLIFQGCHNLANKDELMARRARLLAASKGSTSPA